jgi:phosphohistidine phosphatase SixA
MKAQRTIAALLAIFVLTGCASQEQAALPTATAPPLISTIAPSPAATPSPTTAPSPTAAPSITPSPTIAPSPTLAPTTPVTPTAGALAGQELVAALRQGGYVIYFRHAATDMTQTDSDLSRCETQRNLNAQGRADARAIGAAFRALDIPVGQVLSSGYCRTRDTAQLAFGRAELVRDLSGLPAAQREQRTATLRKLLATTPETGTNTVLVSHGFNITAAAEITIGEGEAAIFAPGAEGTFTLVARVRPNEWQQLMDAAGAAFSSTNADSAP